MTRKSDLEAHIRQSYEFIRDYEAIQQTTSDPREKARCRRIIGEQWKLINGYLRQYRQLVQGTLPPDLAEIAANASGDAVSSHIEQGENLVIGDKAQLVKSGRPDLGFEPPTITVSLLTQTVPTAYCHQLQAEDFPLITIDINHASEASRESIVRVRAHIEGYSDPAIASSSIAPEKSLSVQLLPLLQPSAVATLNELRPATLQITVEQRAPVERILYDQTRRIRLHAWNTALLAIKGNDGVVRDLTDYLAAWVTPRHRQMEKLLRRAVEYHPERRFVGYQEAATYGEAADTVRSQARAIFNLLKEEVEIVYVNSPLNLGSEAGQVTQRVRLPSETVDSGGSANCIDGTVLFASLLELASIEPLLVLVPGHAFVGWRIWRDVEQYEFLESTMIGTHDFEAAQEVAQQQYAEMSSKGYFDHHLFHPEGFARLIDVAASRERGILPLQ